MTQFQPQPHASAKTFTNFICTTHTNDREQVKFVHLTSVISRIMAPWMPNIFRRSQGEGAVNMTREEEQAIIQANIANLQATLQSPFAEPVTTPAPIASRWSRTAYSVSIYTEDSRFDEDASTLRAPTPAPAPDPPNASITITEDDKKNARAHKIMAIVGSIFLLLSALAVLIYLVTHGKGANSKPSSAPPHDTTASTSTSQTHAAVLQPTTNSDLTSSSPTTSESSSQQHGVALSSITSSHDTHSASSTIAVIHVSTEVVRTTVGTLTTSALTNAGTSSGTIIRNTTFSA